MGLHAVFRSVVLVVALTVAARGEGLKHVVFAYVDHFENPAAPCFTEPTLQSVEQYWPALALRHQDGDGRHPVHDFFLIQELAWPDTTWSCLESSLPRVSRIAYQGVAEVNLHLHHRTAYNSLRRDAWSDAGWAAMMNDTIAAFNAHGALLTAQVVPQSAFAFIHGGWSLDASRPLDNTSHHLCWIRWELKYLRQYGCFVDMTFPAWGIADANPLVTDSIFYAQDDAEPGSYKNPANIRPVEVGQPEWGDLMIVEGPNCYTSIDTTATSHAASLARMDEWVGHNVHVVGRDDWVFVKIYTHWANYGEPINGSVAWNYFFGPSMERFYTDIERVYNDGVNWKLHYVSAREMYNIIKAAEAGLSGDPNQYRDYVVPPYANSLILTPNRYRLLSYSKDLVLIERLDSAPRVEFSLRQFGPCSLVEECDKLDSWAWETRLSGFVCSNALRGAGDYGELHFVDNTPSKYYRIRSGSACDFDGNGAVDTADFQLFISCAGGPANEYGTECGLPRDTEGRVAADLDHDGDVDQDDFGAFQRCLTGPIIP